MHSCELLEVREGESLVVRRQEVVSKDVCRDLVLSLVLVNEFEARELEVGPDQQLLIAEKECVGEVVVILGAASRHDVHEQISVDVRRLLLHS